MGPTSQVDPLLPPLSLSLAFLQTPCVHLQFARDPGDVCCRDVPKHRRLRATQLCAGPRQTHARGRGWPRCTTAQGAARSMRPDLGARPLLLVRGHQLRRRAERQPGRRGRLEQGQLTSEEARDVLLGHGPLLLSAAAATSAASRRCLLLSTYRPHTHTSSMHITITMNQARTAWQPRRAPARGGG